MGRDQHGIPEATPIGFVRGRPVWPIAGGDGTDDGGGDAPPDGQADTSLVPEAIRNSPEFRALAADNRRLARERGSAVAEAARIREQAERERQAAEATRAAEMERSIKAVLGEAGVAAWTEIAELSATDQMAAARRFAEVMAGAAQSAPAAPPAAPATTAATTPAAPAAPAPTGGTVAATAPPPPPSSGVDGGQPLGQPSTAEDYDGLITNLSKEYQDVVDRNQDPSQRNRVTMRDRGKALMSYLGAAYLKAPEIRGRLAGSQNNNR